VRFDVSTRQLMTGGFVAY